MKKRKTNRSKRVSSGCRNHGDCDYCRSNRLHQARKASVSAKQQMEEPVCGTCGNKGRVIMYAPDGDCGSKPCPDCQPAPGSEQRQEG